MKQLSLYILLIGFGCLLESTPVWAQKDTLAIAKGDVNQDDLGIVNDSFQTYFFEALAQKAIENHEKAIDALLKCQPIKPKEGAVYFELGKNYAALKQYQLAEENFKEALSLKPDYQPVLVNLFQLYFETQAFTSAIKTAKELVKFDSHYQEELANLYLLTEQYQKALDALDAIDAKQGTSEYRNNLRRKIYTETNNPKAQIAYLKQQLSKQPDNLQHYTNLIYLYSQQGNLKEAYSVALALQKRQPDAPQAHLALYKMHMDEKAYDKAIESMKRVLESDAIDADIKKKVVEDFVSFVQKNPQYEGELVSVLGEELNHGKQSDKQLGEYYIGKDNSKALAQFKKAYQNNPSDFEVIKKLGLLQVKAQQYTEVLRLTEAALAIYPAQPILYLLRGVALNSTNAPEEAEETLLMGVDFLIDDPTMEADFYEQLQLAAAAQGNTKKAEEYQKQVNALKQ